VYGYLQSADAVSLDLPKIQFSSAEVVSFDLPKAPLAVGGAGVIARAPGVT